MPDTPKTVAVVGAGPVGLAAAVRILERGMRPIVLEAGPDVGQGHADHGHVEGVEEQRATQHDQDGPQPRAPALGGRGRVSCRLRRTGEGTGCSLSRG